MTSLSVMDTGKVLSDVYYLNSGYEINTGYAADHNPDYETKAIMVYVDFPNVRAEDHKNKYGDPSYYYDILARRGLELFNVSSYGRFKLRIDCADRFFRMPKEDHVYKMERVITAEIHRNYIADALRVSGEYIDYSGYDIVYIVPVRGSAVPYSPTLIDRSNPVKVENGAQTGLCVTFGADMYFRFGKLLAHETGHIFGLPDLYTYEETPEIGAFAHCGGWDLMGLIDGKAPDFHAYQKWRLGWIYDSEVCVAKTGEKSSFRIAPLEIPGGSKLIMIPIDEYTAYAVESRRGIAIDEALGDKQGVLVYYIDGHLHSGGGCMTVIPPQKERIFRLRGDSNDELFGLGEDQIPEFFDEERNIRIKVTESDASGETVEIERR